MSHFSNLDVALSEMRYGRGAENVRINSIGVCLDDTGQPVKLYIVDTIYRGCGTIEIFSLDDDFAPDGYLREGAVPRELHISDFWALT